MIQALKQNFVYVLLDEDKQEANLEFDIVIFKFLSQQFEMNFPIYSLHTLKIEKCL